VPWPGDLDAPGEDDGRYPEADPWPCGSEDDDDEASLSGPAPAWPALPAALPPAFARPARAGSARAQAGRPPAGLLDVALPWAVLAGLSAAPGHLGRIGPVTAAQARQAAEVAAADPAAQWRIIVTNSAGQALAVTRVPRPPGARAAGPDRPAAAPGTGLVGRVTLTISQDTLTLSQHDRASPPGRDPPRSGPPGGGPPGGGAPGGIVAAALRAATRAAALAAEQARADAAAGGCAHQAQSAGYRPAPGLRQHVAARDLTCRSPCCRQPAWRGDLDHTIAWDNGGRTCSCNLGGVCRTHHLIKQMPGWTLRQPRPGIFEWTTPSGRTYTVTPDIHPL
jgi:hypothetical protein